MTDLATHPTQAASAWLADFDAALRAQDVAAAVALFDADCYWRDLVAFTWNIRTQEGPEAIRAMLQARLADTQPGGFAVEGEATEADGVIDAWFTFETAVARGRGHLRLKNGKAWTLLTTMTELKGLEEHKGERRVKGAEHGVHPGRKTWLEQRAGRGRHAGPHRAALRGDRRRRPGRHRAGRAAAPPGRVGHHRREERAARRLLAQALQEPVPARPGLVRPPALPALPRRLAGVRAEGQDRRLAGDVHQGDGAQLLGLAPPPRRRATTRRRRQWEVVVERDGKEITLRPKELVFALGVSGYPNVPQIPGAETFLGEQHHSSQHPGPEAYKGKKCVVLGSNNSAHDICAALWEHGADVTMVQRSSTHIAPSDSLMELALGGLYSEQAVKAGVTTNMADLIFASIPYKIMAPMQVPVYDEMKKRDADLYARLEKAGFMLDFGVDGSGLFMKYLRRGSGYYIDVGASELVANGSIKLKSGVTIERINPNSVTLSDGSELPADLIVYATGYGSMNGWLADLISPEVADRVGKVWGLGSDTPKDPGPWEGELRNMWKPTQVPHLWFHGGNLHQSRHYSEFLALQLKARQEGIPTPVYRLAPSHHKR